MIRLARHIMLLMALLTGALAWTQAPIRTWVVPSSPPDSADLARASRPRFWRAAAEVAGFNVGLWAFDDFVCRGDYARISLSSVKENFRHGFKYDNDKLGTNMFLHPYNGSLYYNAARSNGFNFWQSSLFAIGGSAMWELFMECEYPSTNDIIATPVAGACIGEVTYRVSDLLVDDRDVGLSRAGREVGVFLVSPMRGLTRLLTGDMWRVRPTRGRQFGTPDVALEFSAGPRTLLYGDRFRETSVGVGLEMNLDYGDRFELRSSKPYDYFSLRGRLNIANGQPVLGELELTGRLLAREFLEDRDTHVSVGIFQHFDYFDSDTIGGADRGKIPYKLGVPASLGVGALFRDIERGGWVADAYLHCNAVILGSILSDYYDVDDRNYNLASGFSVKAGVNLVFGGDKFSLSLYNRLYRLYTWKGYGKGVSLARANRRTLDVQGDKSQATFNVTELRGDLRLSSHFYLSLSLAGYLRHTAYRDYPDVSSFSLSGRLMLTYKL